jgi:hypothetical protein
MKFAYLAAGIALAALLASCSSNETTTAPPAPATAHADQASASPAPTWVPPAPVATGGLTYQVLSARYVTSLPTQDGCADPADTNFVCGYVSGSYEVTYWRITNNTSQPVVLNGSQFWDTMCGEDTSTDSQAESEAAPALWGASQPTIDDNDVDPGQSVEGGAIFDVPGGCTNRYVIVGENAANPGPGKRVPLS